MVSAIVGAAARLKGKEEANIISLLEVEEVGGRETRNEMSVVYPVVLIVRLRGPSPILLRRVSEGHVVVESQGEMLGANGKDSLGARP